MTEPESSRTRPKRAAAMTEPESSRTRPKRAATMTEPESSPTRPTEPECFHTRPKWAYDVFLSFRGEDTRKNFTDHLYAALDQAGIHTFRDDNELPRGEEISKHLLKAIHESKISIVVFSKGYASSRWCLNELVEILECKNRNTDQIVLPIFYDIDPSDVRKQTGSFVEAFDKHEERFKEKVQEWRKALEEAGSLSGWNLNDMANGHESKFIQKIIEDVLNKLDTEYLYVATHLVGIDPIVCNISNFLTTTTDGVRMVGIHGMAGIGKTTIAKAVFNQLCYGFEGSCFLSNVKERSEQPNGLVLLQQQLLREILKRKIWNISDVDRGMKVIEGRLCHKKILVVLDDVDDLQQLNALMRERSWYGPESRVIITTRDERLLEVLGVDKQYEVTQLGRYASLQLFSWHAFRDICPPEDYVELSSEVADYCGGLPLALEVLGSSLFKEDKIIWESTIDKLRKIPDDRIQEKLRISFDALKDDKLKNSFLDIACFFIGRRKRFVAKVIEGRCGFNPEVYFRTLIKRSLITVDGWDEINMHDLLRDMGREIIRQEYPDLLEKRSRIWDHEDAWNVLINQTGTKKVEGLAVDVRASEVEPLSTKSFTAMIHLQLLKIDGVHLNGRFNDLPKGLIWLCWHGCPLESLPSDFELGKLVVLDMRYSNIKELWKETKVLNKLKILNLSYCKYLAKMPNFQRLPNLERLILKNCTGLVEVPQSIGHLKSLKTLNVCGCSRLEKFPESMGDMESLTELLADGVENEQFLFSIVDLKNLKKLSFRGYSFNQDSPSFTSWVSLISPWLSLRGLNWKALLPSSLAHWSCLLKKLKLGYSGVSEGATKCVDFGSLSSLEELDLAGNKFLNLPSGIGRLPKLKILWVSFCEDLLLISELPSSLAVLFAIGCTSMERVRLPIQLKGLDLDIDLCPNLMEIEGVVGLDHDYLGIDCNRSCDGLSKNALSRFIAEGMSNIYCDCDVCFPNDEIPDWFSYREGEQSSLSFHLPPFFHGLVFWIGFESVTNPGHFCVIIKNKSNDIQLFQFPGTDFFGYRYSWVGYVGRKNLAMKEYCGEELELYVEISPEFRSILRDRFEIIEIGVHVIVEKPDSVEESESEWEWDRDIDNLQGTTSSADVEEGDGIDSRLYHHRLRHPLWGSIACSTMEQWKSYLQMKFSKMVVTRLVARKTENASKNAFCIC